MRIDNQILTQLVMFAFVAVVFMVSWAIMKLTK